MTFGYAAYSRALDQPGDRRRFPAWAARRGIAWEHAEPGDGHDVVVVTPRADLDAWARLPRGGTKLVFDLVDAYPAVPRHDPKALLRGPAKFATGQARHPFFHWHRALDRVLRRADAVTCASPEQAALIAPLCANAHPILDLHSDLVRRVKDDYRIGAPARLVWEGLGENVRWFGEISGALASVHRDRPLVVHLITAVEFHQWAQRVWRRSTARVAARHVPAVEVHPWSEATVSEIAAGCDLAVIPLPLDRPLEAGKPESKLVSFWRMGLPTLTSATPAYSRVMRAAGQDLACAGEAAWERALRRLLDDDAARERAGREGRAFAEHEYADERLLAAWDRVFASLV